MPQFILNKESSGGHPFYSLNEFARGYVEAMFFTNGDTGDERENLLNDWGVEKLTRKAVAAIADYCATFERDNADLLAKAYGKTMPARTIGDGSLPDSHRPAWDYDAPAAGRDLWFTTQGHGVGYWDRDCLEVDSLGDLLSEAAKKAGECYVTAYRGWIHFYLLGSSLVYILTY